jgi:type II secretory pathway pseudopilin PulG
VGEVRRSAAFSLIELLGVVTILGILAALILPRVSVTNAAAEENVCHHNCVQVNSLVEQYFMHHGAWPADNLSDIAADVDYFPQGMPTCPVSGQAYQLDSTTHRVVGHDGAGSH